MTIDARPGRLRIDVTELRLNPGTTRKIELTTVLPDIAVGDVVVADDAPVTLDLLLEGIKGGVDVTGTVSVAWSGPCRRCLETIEGELRTEVHEIFAEDHVDGETYPIDRDTIDLREMTRDVIVLDLPLAPLCREDCAGPVPDIFPIEPATDATDSEDSVTERPRDPRWAALDELRAQLEDDSDPPDQVG